MAPARGAEPAGVHAGQAHGLPRDHAPGDPPRHREPARHRPPPRRRPGGPPAPRPHLRLRTAGQRRPAEGRPRRHRRPGAERRPPGSSSSASASGWRSSRPATGTSTATFSSAVAAGVEAGRQFTATLVQLDGRRVATRQGLRPDAASSAAAASSCSTRPRAERARRRAARPPTFARALGRAQALPAPPGRPVHHLDVPAGGRPQAPPVGVAWRCARRRASTRAATSPTCGPTPRRCRRRRSPRPAREITERYGAQYLPDAPRAVRQEGQERPGGPRGHPPGRRLVPVARGGGPRGQRQRRPGLRADLEAHDRLADDRRHRRDRHGPPRRAGPRRGRDAEFTTSGTIITHQGFRLAYVESTATRATTPTSRSASSRRSPRATRSTSTRVEPARPRDPAAGPLHRGVARQAARGARRRSALDLRVDHQDDPGPRATSGRRASALVPVVHGVRRRQPARAALPRPGRLRLHRPHGGRPRRDRRRRRGAGPLAHRVLLRRRPAADGRAGDGLGLKAMVADRPRRHRRRRHQLHPASASTPTASRSWPSPGAQRPLRPARRRHRVASPTTLAPDELTVEKALELLAAPKGDRVLGDDPATGLPIYAKGGRFGPYVQLGDYDDDGRRSSPRWRRCSRP